MSALIREFTIVGLHGYKNISINLDDDLRVIVAMNGLGKTTILTALYEIISGRISELRAIDFKEIRIRIENNDEEVITKKDLNFKLPEEIYSTQLISEYKHYCHLNTEDISSLIIQIIIDINELVFDKYSRANIINEMRNFTWFEDLDQASPLTYPEMHAHIAEFHSWALEHNLFDQPLFKLQKKFSKYLSEYDVLFLPTYRRVEKPSSNVTRRFEERSRFARGRRKNASEHNIAFGLSDVEDKLEGLGEEIERRSNLGYRSLSASMLDDLLSTDAQNLTAEQSQLPDIADLSRFLSRVMRKDELNGIVERVEDFYSSKTENTYLSYFLSQLNNVISSTKQQEEMISKFVTICNKYLKNDNYVLSKYLTFDLDRLKVIVQDDYTRKDIPLNALSSGEKQIISLFAYVYLDSKPKIILLDEPELSLSMTWQKTILQDLMDSGNIAQMIAITHSPFIFSNKNSRTKAKSFEITVDGEGVDYE